MATLNFNGIIRGGVIRSMQILGYGANPNPNPPGPTPLQVSRSIRLNTADSAGFEYTPVTAGSTSTWTWSGWVKRDKLLLTDLYQLFGMTGSASNTYIFLRFDTTNNLEFQQVITGTSTYRLRTTARYADAAQWYHVVLAFDTGNATAADRIRLYVNGTRVETLQNAIYPNQYVNGLWNSSTYVHYIGRGSASTAVQPFSGYMADINFIDGRALDASYFGETDSATGQWVPKSYTDSYGYGYNGFYLPLNNNATAGYLGFNGKDLGYDGYWPYTTMLVNTGNTNGATNNTFLDSSTNNFAVTRNGTTQQVPNNPFAFGSGTPQTNGYYSGYFDGTGDYLDIAAGNTSLNLGTGDFTIEFWMRGPILTNAGTLIDNRNPDTANQGFDISMPGTSAVLRFTTSGTAYITGTAVLGNNTWYHVALSRSGNTFKLFVNGQQTGSTYTGSATQNFTNTNWRIGSGAVGAFQGFISNVRILKGTALYTANFAVPTTPLTAIANTSLLTCQSSTFIDNSGSSLVISSQAQAQPEPANPFGMTQWSTYFDGTGDELTVPASADLTLGAGDFTLECWVYLTGTQYREFGYDIARTHYNIYEGGWAFTINGTYTHPYFAPEGYGVSFYIGPDYPEVAINSSIFVAVGVWTHIAVVRSGTAENNVKVYVDGQLRAAGTNNSNDVFAETVTIGKYLPGYISNLRFVKGTAVYTSEFTPPTEPLTAIPGTELLCCQSATFTDNSSNGFTITPAGQVYNTTTNDPFGSEINYDTAPTAAWSMFYDASSDALSPPNLTPTFNIGGSLWTMECWFNLKASTASQTVFLYAGGVADQITITLPTPDHGLVRMVISATNYPANTTNSTSPGAGMGPYKINTWNHICVTRNKKTEINCYINGSLITGATIPYNTSFDDSSFNGATFLGRTVPYCRIGSGTSPTSNQFNGLISNFRFVVGKAVYGTGSNFTVPTAPLQPIAGTRFMAAASYPWLGSALQYPRILVSGNVSMDANNPFTSTNSYQPSTSGGSIYLDGVGDNLLIANNANLDLPGDFTIECWANFSALGTNRLIVERWSTGIAGGWQLYWRQTGTSITFFANNAVILQDPSTTAIQINTWNHIAVTRSGTTARLFVNGQQVASATLTTALTNSLPLVVGETYSTLTNDMQGYVTGIRIIKGTALYTTNFALPVLPATAVANTQVLLNATNAGIYDVSNFLNNIESVGDAQASTTVAKWGNSSIYFDGTGDYLQTGSANSNFGFGTNNFTVEFWMNPHNVSGGKQLIDMRTGVINTPMVDIFQNNNTVGFFYSDLTRITGNTTISANTWTHVALCRTNSVTKLFVNGIQQNTTFADTTNYGNANVRIGIANDGGASTSYYRGYLQDIRITKAGRYANSFTPPTAPFSSEYQDSSYQQWNPLQLSVDAGVNNDSLIDTPSNYGTDTGLGGQVGGSYAILDYNHRGTTTLSNGGLNCTTGATATKVFATLGMTTGKWYWETAYTAVSGGARIGIANNWSSTTTFVGQDANSYGYTSGGLKISNNSSTSVGTTYTTNNVIGTAFDADTGSLYFYKNGNAVSSGAAFYSGLTQGPYMPVFSNDTAASSDFWVNFGQRAFTYTAPTGYKCLVSNNLDTEFGNTAATQVSKYFNVILNTGANIQTTANALYTHELQWIKGTTDNATNHQISTAATGANVLITNLTDAQTSYATPPGNAVGWVWSLPNTGVTNNSGNIVSTVSANTVSGVSVVTWTGNGANASTIGHGLGSTPDMIVFKRRNGATNWPVYHKNLGPLSGIFFNLTSTSAATTAFANTSPTSSVFSVGTLDTVNTNGATYMAMCFAEKPGFSAIGRYIGSGGTESAGGFIYTGFRPAWLWIKRADSAVYGGYIWDDQRLGYNHFNNWLAVASADAQGSNTSLVILSNGFQWRTADAYTNAANGIFLYMAFAEFPFKYARGR
jgi:hypothetical protein